MPFICSICGEESTRICARCTKDACNNHLCEKCLRCSDCCECEVTLTNSHPPIAFGSARSAIIAASAATAHEAVPPPPIQDVVDSDEPEPPHPPPDPDPFPEDEEAPGPVNP